MQMTGWTRARRPALPATLNFCLRDGMRGLGPLTYIGGVNVLSLQRRAHRRFHHQLGKMHSSLVQSIDRRANSLVVVGIHHRVERCFELANSAVLLRRQLVPRGILAALLQGG